MDARGGKDDGMRGWPRCQAAIKMNAVILIVVLGLMGATGCKAAPPSSLSDPAKFRTAVHALRTDLSKAARDFRREKHDARLGADGRRGEPRCYNLRNNVNFVVLKTIRNFVLLTVTADRKSVQIDINHIRHDRTTFKQDMFDFLNDGVARPAGAKRAIEQITARIILAKSRANRLISAINRVVRNAYNTGNTLAAGHCIGDGPGNQVPQVALVA
jgi:hypothetical protein